MNTVMQHNPILFLISLPDRIISEMLSKNVDYSSCLNEIRCFAEVHEEITEVLLAKANKYKILIIVGECKGDFLELANGQFLSLQEDIVNSIPKNFDGIVDLSFCNSESIKTTIEQRCKQSLVVAADGPTGVETRLELYSILLRHSLLDKDNYKSNFNLVLHAMLDKEEKMPMLDKLPESTKLGDRTAYFPKTMSRGVEYPFHVFVHEGNKKIEKNRRRVIVEGTSRVPIDNKGLEFWFSDLAKGDKITISMEADTDQIIIKDLKEPLQPFTWNGHQIHGYFTGTLTNDFVGESFFCSIKVFVNDNLVDICPQKIYVSNSIKNRPHNSKTEVPIIPGRPKQAGIPITKPFIYKANRAGDRLKILWEFLIENKWIDENTNWEDFSHIFSYSGSGEEKEEEEKGSQEFKKIIWTGHINTLADLFRRLVKKEVIKVPKEYSIWVMVDGLFWEKEKGSSFGNDRLRSTHSPKKEKDKIIIDNILTLLNEKKISNKEISTYENNKVRRRSFIMDFDKVKYQDRNKENE